MPEISIIIPIYNKKRHISDTVRSVLDQSFDDFELLLIDDGSTDGSGKLCDEIASSDARISVIHTENRGVSAARNKGLEYASGRYAAFIDADDRIDRTFLEKLRAAMISEDADMAVCGYHEIRNGKIKLHRYNDLESGDRLYDYIREDMLCILWNKLFVRDKIRHLFDEELSTCEDSIFCIRYYLDNDPKIAVINESLYEYSAYEDGLTSTYRDGAYDGICRLLAVNGKLCKTIADERLRRLAGHHIFKVYFYGIYTYIFGNLAKGHMNRDSLEVIGRILDDKRYRKIIGILLRNSERDKDAEGNSPEEFMIALFSVLRMKRAIWLLEKVKNVCKRK